jgi:CO dehydrogenase/acetyl-CoA synthase gamma subunit (corrinoid Fe-S protein)
MTFEERQIAAIRGATSDMQELNTKLDELLSPELANIVLALILKHYDMEDLDSIYKYICTNYNVESMDIKQVDDLILSIERCQNEDCKEWNLSKHLVHSIYYDNKRVCPECIRSI